MTAKTISRLIQPVISSLEPVARHIKHDKREPRLFKEEFRCTEVTYLCSKTYCCFDKSTDKTKFSSKVLNKRTLEETTAGPLKNTDAYSTRKRVFNHQIRVSEQFNILFAHTSKQREDCQILIRNELFSTTEFTKSHSFCKLLAIIVHGKHLFDFILSKFDSLNFCTTFLIQLP